MNHVLNRLEFTESAPAIDPSFAKVLLDFARKAKAAALRDPTRTSCAYRDQLRQLDRAAARLQTFEPDRWLADRSVALAFWINLYNAMVIHGALRLGVRGKMTEVKAFFKRTAYRIADQRFNLDVIEHAILRQNRGHPLRFGVPQLLPGDARRRWIVKPMDERIHFALNCGARSCPPIRHYEPSRIDAQLDLAAASFVSQAVTVRTDGNGVQMSRLFLWYARDFGWTRRAQLASAVKYLDAAERARIVAAARRGIRYGDYDWSFG